MNFPLPTATGRESNLSPCIPQHIPLVVPRVYPPGQADDMCIIINTSLRFIDRYRPLEISKERVKFVALRTGSHWDGVLYILEDLL